MWIGPGFPLAKGIYGYPEIKKGIELIKDSIEQILLTRKGERVMLRNFGSNLHKLVFESNDELMEELIRIEVEEVINEWEPRVKILSVRADRQEHEVRVSITFMVIGSGEVNTAELSLTI